MISSHPALTALLRSLLAASAAGGIALLTRGWLADRLRRPRPLALWLVMLPLLMPAILPGYVFGTLSVHLLNHPFRRELLYLALLILRFTPVCLLVFAGSPPSSSAAALHCSRLAMPAIPWYRRLQAALRLDARRLAAGASLVMLLTFTEFEIASLMNIPTWSVALFDAHAGGIPLSESLRLAAGPLTGAFLLLGTALFVILRAPTYNPGTAGVPEPLSRPRLIATRLYTGLALMVTVILPLAYIMIDALRALPDLADQFVIAEDMTASITIAAAAAVMTLLPAGLLFPWKQGLAAGPGRTALMILVCLPGLTGALLTGLMVLSIFQLPVFNAVYRTPLPLAGALVILLLPYAVILLALQGTPAFRRSLFLARLTAAAPEAETRRRSRRLSLRLGLRWTMWVCALLGCWAYVDMQIAALLAPPGMTPVFVRLYNLMHYGRSSMLSAMVLISLIPVCILLGLLGLRRPLPEGKAHA